MKLSIAQALGTVLNIQIALIRSLDKTKTEDWFVIQDIRDQGFSRPIGKVKDMTLDQAVWKAAEMTDFKDECSFAIFPIQSGREDFYMAIEREMLRQEASEEFGGKKMWEFLGNDPRELITAIMTQLRDCAVSIITPPQFQINMLRVCVLCIASMQWISDWLTKLRLRQAALTTERSDTPKVVPIRPTIEPIAPLFGVAGLQVLKEKESPIEITVIDGGEEVPPLILRKEKLTKQQQAEENDLRHEDTTQE